VPKIILYGSSSELGIATANKFLNSDRYKFTEIVTIGRKAETSKIVWQPEVDSLNEITRVNFEAQIAKNDLVVIALGSLPRLELEVDPSNWDLQEIGESIFVTCYLSVMVFLKVAKDFYNLGGGQIIIFSSVASSPVLPANIFYGSSKFMLDKIVFNYQKALRKSKVEVSLVKPAYVDTKLNANRKPTSFSISVGDVSNYILSQFPNRIIWIPGIFRAISLILTKVPIFKRIANKAILKSIIS